MPPIQGNVVFGTVFWVKESKYPPTLKNGEGRFILQCLISSAQFRHSAQDRAHLLTLSYNFSIKCLFLEGRGVIVYLEHGGSMSEDKVLMHIKEMTTHENKPNKNKKRKKERMKERKKADDSVWLLHSVTTLQLPLKRIANKLCLGDTKGFQSTRHASSEMYISFIKCRTSKENSALKNELG